MSTVRSCWTLALLVCLAACAKTVVPSAGGSESHFLDACEETSDCGGELSCYANVCTRACESDDPCEALDDAAICVPEGVCGVVQDMTETLIGTSAVLGEPARLAFIAGSYADEQLWLMGESGALRQVSLAPAPEAWTANTCLNELASTYASGHGRFASPTFDSHGEYLAFVERESCDYFTSDRLIVHDLATGRTRSLGTFGMLTITTGPRSTYVLDTGVDNGPQFNLYRLDAATSTLTRIEVSAGNEVNAGSLDVVGFEGDEVLVAVGSPVLRASDEGVEVFEPIDQLGPNWQLGTLRASPAGDQLCVTTRDVTSPPDADVALAVLVTSEGVSMQSIEDFGFECAFSADGRLVMYGGTAFEIVDDELVPLPVPSEPMQVAGAHGEAFFGTNDRGEVVRFEPVTDSSEVLITLDELDALCGGALRENPNTRMYVAADGRGVAVVKHYCGSPDLDESASVALDLATGDWSTIEPSNAPGHTVYDVAWPRGEGAWLFSSPAGDESSRFYAIEAGPEVTERGFPELDGILHSPAWPR